MVVDFLFFKKCCKLFLSHNSFSLLYCSSPLHVFTGPRIVILGLLML